MQIPMNELLRQHATTIVSRLKSGEITPFDCLDALEARIAEVDPKVNALPTLCFDRARAEAERADEEAGGRARAALRTADPDQGPQ